MSEETADIAILLGKAAEDRNFTVEVINDGITVATGEYITRLSALKFASIQLMLLREQEKENNK
jgi:hypothetical protein